MKRLLVFVLAALAITCICAFSVSAATPDENGETVTLSDTTVLPIWDTDGDALIWYKSTANADDGYPNYDYVKAQASEVDYITGWAGAINGVHANQVGTVTITVGGKSYGKDDIVVFNVKDDDVVVTTSTHGSVGKSVNCFGGTFKSSTSLEYVFLKPETVALQQNAFTGASKLQYVNFTELTSLNQIFSQCFNGCTSLLKGQAIDLSNTVMKSLESGVFVNVPATAILFPDTLVALKAWSLQSLTKLEEIHIPERITSFGDTMFKNCASLKKVTGYGALFERGVLSTIQTNTFYGCSSLESVDIPENFTAVGSGAFYGTTALKGTFRIPDNCTSLGSTAFQGAGFETIIIGTGITSISDNMFREAYCKYIVISESVTSIAGEAFRGLRNKTVFYYTGSDAAGLKNITVDKSGYNSAIIGASTICVSADEFDVNNKNNENYIVYGVDFCTAFYGEHLMNENLVFGATLYEEVCLVSCCARASCNNVEAKAGVESSLGYVIEEKGYSSCDIGGIKSFTRGFYVNTELLNVYEELYGSVSIGFAFALAENVDMEGDLALSDFAINMVLKEKGQTLSVNNLDYIIRYKNDSRLDTMVVVAGYYEAEEAVFSGIESVSYNSVAKQGSVTVNPDGSVDGSVDIGSLLGGI